MLNDVHMSRHYPRSSVRAVYVQCPTIQAVTLQTWSDLVSFTRQAISFVLKDSKPLLVLAAQTAVRVGYELNYPTNAGVIRLNDNSLIYNIVNEIPIVEL